MSYQADFDYQPYFPYAPAAGMQMQTQKLRKYEIIHVTGRNGAEALQMAPGSNVLLLDDTAPLVWLCQTDGAGYKTVIPYTIAPYQEPAPISVDELNARIARLEEMLSAKPDTEPVKPSTKRKPDSNGADS